MLTTRHFYYFSMSKPEHKPLGDDLPLGIGRPAHNALIHAGYLNLEQISKLKGSELGKLHGVGPKAIGIIPQALAARGLSFKED